MKNGRPRPADRRIRYAVVGLGHIAQHAVLPAFANAKQNSQLAALVSDDDEKLKELGKKYKVGRLCSYADYDACLAGDDIDAVYIALPNHLHAEYAVRAARAGKHVLCEKPMAVTEEACRQMIDAANEADVRLMIAYRLHFEEANLKAVEIVQSGKIGEPRFFQSTFCMQVREGNIRVRRDTGGGTLYDIGIYCINAARYLFRAEPYEVAAFSESGPDPRFSEVDEMTGALLRFPGNRLAVFTSSFGATDIAEYRVVGTEGELCIESAYEYEAEITHYLTIGGKTKKRKFAKRDQFGPELVYFSQCILDKVKPEPCGHEGLADVRVIEAVYRSAAEGKPQRVEGVEKMDRPSLKQEIRRKPARKPRLVHAAAPHL